MPDLPSLMPPQDAVLVQLWSQHIAQTEPQIRQTLTALGQQHSAHLADAFYRTMLADPQAGALLTHDEVNTRLHQSMQRWVTQLLGSWDAAQVPALVTLQRHIGQVHARVNVGLELVVRGARQLKHDILQALLRTEADPPQTLRTAMAAHHLIDLALEAMSMQYKESHDQATRTDEAYRSLASSVNMSLERERQRTALLDWQGQFLQEVMMMHAGDEVTRLGQSSFGLWVQHKANAFNGLHDEREAILNAMRRIDADLLPRCETELMGKSEELRRLTRQILTELQQIRYFTDSMFEHLVDMESGRDALTQLLNRRYLPAVLSRELELSRRSGHPFSLMLVDVDHFKQINDQHGHSCGDRALQHLATLLSNTVRSGDFVFRFGGEEFIIVSVEMPRVPALREAEKIRQAVEKETILLPEGRRLRLTVSIGVATYDGHPDYQHLIEQADQALYAAKSEGRNRVVPSQRPQPT